MSHAHKKDYKTSRQPKKGWVKVGYSLQASTVAMLDSYAARTKRLKSEILDVALLQYLAALTDREDA
jgi:hypothetical protein